MAYAIFTQHAHGRISDTERFKHTMSYTQRLVQFTALQAWRPTTLQCFREDRERERERERVRRRREFVGSISYKTVLSR